MYSLFFIMYYLIKNIIWKCNSYKINRLVYPITYILFWLAHLNYHVFFQAFIFILRDLFDSEQIKTYVTFKCYIIFCDKVKC